MDMRELYLPFLLLAASVVAHGQVTLTTTPSNSLNVNVTNTNTTANQTITALNQCAQVLLGGAGSVKVWITSISGTSLSGNLAFSVSGDGTNFTQATLYPDPQGSGVGVTQTPSLSSVAAGNSWSGNLAGGTTFQVCGASVGGTSPSVLVQVTASSAPLVSPGCVLGSLGQCNVGIVSGTVAVSGTVTATLTPSGASGNGTSATFINATGALAYIKAAQGNLYGFHLTNHNGTTAYIEFWNLSSGIVLGTTAPTYAWECPGSAQCFVTLNLPIGFVNGIAYAAVTVEGGSTTATMTGVIEYK